MTFYNFAKNLLSGIIKMVFRVKVIGAENSENLSSAIVCSNHISNWDPVILACALKCPVNYMAKEELFEIPIFGKIIKALGAFPINRGASDIAAIKTTLSLIKDGNNVCMFPQGTRCTGVEPSQTEFKSGAAMMLNHADSLLLPAAIYTKNYTIKPLRRVYIIVGKPKSREDYGFEDNSREEYERVSREIFSDICALLKKPENV